jgi:hypothetical protein
MDGASDSAVILTDDDGAAYEDVRDNVSVTANTDTHVARFFVKKDSDTTRFPGLQLHVGTQKIQPHFNTSTGAITTVASTGTVDSDVRDTGAGWWEVLLSVANDGAQTTANVYIYPAAGSVFGTNSAAATGSITLHSAELHLSTTIAAVRGMPPLLATSGATVTVNATDYSCDDANHDDTQGAWYAEVYHFIERGSGGNHQYLTMNLSAGGGQLLGSRITPMNALTNDSTSTINSTSSVMGIESLNKVGMAYGDSSRAITLNGTTVTGSYDGAFPNDLGKISFTNANSVPYMIRSVQRYDLDYTAAQAKIDELMA